MRVVTREQLKATLVKAYGGRAAEELVFGKEHVTTGAASDIQQATNIARRYVSQWGLSDVVGPILVGDDEQELFLGREIQSRRHISSSTAQLVDAEISKLIRESYQRATEVLTENLDLLHAVAAALLERETLTGAEVKMLARGKHSRRGHRQSYRPHLHYPFHLRFPIRSSHVRRCSADRR